MQTSSAVRLQEDAYAAPSRILVATDLADDAYLVPHAVAQAKATKAHVTLLHAILPEISITVEAGATPMADQLPLDRNVRSMLLDMARQFEAHGISCDSVSKRGYAPDVIREELRTSSATRLIIGTHGRGKLGQFVIGSVASEMFRTVDVPIFAVGPHAENGADHSLPRKILTPVSLRGECQGTVDFAIELARIYEAELSLLNVMSPSAARGDAIRWTKSALAAFAHDGMNLASPVQVDVVVGNVVEEILKAATRTNADWIVMGVDRSCPFLPVKESKAYHVVVSANCPVLTIRHDQSRVEQKKPGVASFASPIE